jgi:hypothetical protein
LNGTAALGDVAEACPAAKLRAAAPHMSKVATARTLMRGWPVRRESIPDRLGRWWRPIPIPSDRFGAKIATPAVFVLVPDEVRLGRFRTFGGLSARPGWSRHRMTGLRTARIAFNQPFALTLALRRLVRRWAK